MNILIDKLPMGLEVCGEFLTIRTDFRVSILFEMMMEDRGLSDVEKLECAVDLYFEKAPKNFEEAISKVVWFYKCGKENEEGGNGKNEVKQKQIFSFEHDAQYIYSAFMSQYGIDLQDVNMHWWKFKALFDGLSDTTEFVKIMGYRSVNLASIKDKEQKAHYRKLKQIYRLPDIRTEKEKQDMIANAFSGLF